MIRSSTGAGTLNSKSPAALAFAEANRADVFKRCISRSRLAKYRATSAWLSGLGFGLERKDFNKLASSGFLAASKAYISTPEERWRAPAKQLVTMPLTTARACAAA